MSEQKVSRRAAVFLAIASLVGLSGLILAAVLLNRDSQEAEPVELTFQSDDEHGADNEYSADDEQRTDSERSNSNHSHGATREAVGNPSIVLKVLEDPASGWNVYVEVDDFRLAPERASTEHIDGEGHMHLYVDGEKVARLYGQWHHLDHLDPGDHEVRVELSANDHVTLTRDGKPISAAVEVSVTSAAGPSPPPTPPAAGLRQGEIHIHEDGFSHTHGAGAPEEWVVTYTSGGIFVPERLEIVTGDTVTFVNESEWGVWPASNIHPTHEIYPEFDPLREIPPGESWSFKFTRRGTWRYHNHSLASETGVIISSGGPEEALAPLDLDVDIPKFADPPADIDPVALLENLDLLELYVSMYGPDAAVHALREATESTGVRCHDMAHQAGRVSYQLFGVAAFTITPHECDSGAIHGVLEALFAERGTAHLEADMRAVCSGMNRYRADDCYHGVGHGIMAWTGYELHESLGICDTLDEPDRNPCYSGVFMENGVAGTSGLSDHSSEYISLVDPHYPCNEVAQRYVRACYDWQPSNLLLHMKLTADELIEFCTGDLMGEVRGLCVRSWSSFHANSNSLWSDANGLAALCDSDRLTDGDRHDCVDGVYMSRFSESASAAVMTGFCSALDRRPPQQRELADRCWAGLLRLAPLVLDEPETIDTFCGSIPDATRRKECEAALG
ncbi:cupredoxin domain-containing protein [Candidatus Poriferisodalis sp.]|uniref:cupredoxin domain-containing protein n=1 Tax=Candidatus Poriferisodalis sp. TaxID=3101277 RepID=UPI003B01987F